MANGNEDSIQDSALVRFSIKELLSQINVKLDKMDNKLDTKADKNLVDVLAIKLESVKSALPPDLLTEHARLTLQNELHTKDITWLNDNVHSMMDWREKSLSSKQLIIPGVAILINLVYTVWSIAHEISTAVVH